MSGKDFKVSAVSAMLLSEQNYYIKVDTDYQNKLYKVANLRSSGINLQFSYILRNLPRFADIFLRMTWKMQSAGCYWEHQFRNNKDTEKVVN